MPMNVIPYIHLLDLFEYMQGFGISRQQILSKAELSEASLCRFADEQQLPSTVFAQLYQISAASIPEPLRDSLWAGGYSGKTFHLVAYTMISARSLKTALNRAHGFYQLLDPQYPKLQISALGASTRLAFTSCDKSEDNNKLYPGLSLWHSFLSWLIGHPIKLERVVLDAPELSNQVMQRMQRLLRFDTIELSATEAYIEFPSHYLDFPLIANAEALDRFLDYAPYEPLLLIESDEPISEQISQLLGEDFRRGIPNLQQLAERLGYSISTLRRKLQREETSYQAIKNHTRRQIALQLLSETELTVKEIAERTGFNEQGSFSRFFRQWQRISPQQFRDKLKQAQQP